MEVRQFTNTPNTRKTMASAMQNEAEVKAIIEKLWDCKLNDYPEFFYIDWFAERGNQLVAHIEFKQRSHPSTQYKTVFMNFDRKYKYLEILSRIAPSFFVVRWSDNVIRYIDVTQIDSSVQTINGEYDRWGNGQHDLETIIEIPVSSMTRLA